MPFENWNAYTYEMLFWFIWSICVHVKYLCICYFIFVRLYFKFYSGEKEKKNISPQRHIKMDFINTSKINFITFEPLLSSKSLDPIWAFHLIAHLRRINAFIQCNFSIELDHFILFAFSFKNHFSVEFTQISFNCQNIRSLTFMLHSIAILNSILMKCYFFFWKR